MQIEKTFKAMLLGASILGLGATSALAVECVKVIGTEPGVPNITMDPAFVNTSDDSYQLNAVYNRMVSLDASFQPIPELAKSWSVSDDGLTWTFNLEQGVTFHDGKPMTSKDVVFSFKRLLDPEVGSPATSVLGFLDPAGITAVDDYTVAFKTPTVVADLPTVLAIKYGMVVPDGSTKEQLKLQSNGTGPFIQDVYSPTETRRVFQRNKNYWRKGLPKAECLELSVITEDVTRLAAIKSGAADLIMQAGAANAGLLAGDPTLKLQKSAPGTYVTLSMWVDTPPFDNVKVRQAVAYAIDRKFVIDNIWFGFGRPATGPINSNFKANGLFTADVKNYNVPNGIELANKLLDEAGRPRGSDGTRFEIVHDITPYGEEWRRFGEYTQQQLGKIGIKVTLRYEDVPSWLRRVYTNYDFQLTSNWIQTLADPVIGVHRLYHSGSIKAGTVFVNSSRWTTPETDDLMNRASVEVDAAKRGALYHDFQKRVVEASPLVFVHELEFVTVHNKRLNNFPLSPLGLYSSFDQVWLSK